MSNLREQKCISCRSDAAAVSTDETQELLTQIPHWQLDAESGTRKLERSYEFKDFRSAFGYAGHVAELADAQDHHPLMMVEWGKVTVQWWTHKINDLHLNDFVMAARSDEIYESFQ